MDKSVSFLLFLLLGLFSEITCGGALNQSLSTRLVVDTRSLTPISRMAATERLRLAIGLPLPDKPALEKFVRDLYAPRNPNYRRFLTSEQFALRFGPSEVDFQKLIDFAAANDFTITGRHPNRLLLDVSASVAQIENVFRIRMEVYQHPSEPRTFYAPDSTPTFNPNLPISFIRGLDNYKLSHPKIRPVRSLRPNVGSGPGGTYLGSDFRNAYAPGVSLTGAGQTIALVEFDGFYTNDIIAYKATAGLPNVPLQVVLLGGYDGIPVSFLGNVEVSLDIELALAMAPGLSKIIVYEAGPSGIPEDVLSRIANDNLAAQISCSWTWQPYDPDSEAIYLQFAAQGQSFFNATGDHNAFVGPILDAPSDDPYVTQVGGTALTMSGSGQSYSGETVWNRGNGVGSSGGISTTYVIPQWQQGINMSSNQGSTSMRNVPDVAMVADDIYATYGNGSGGSVAGVSCAAPLWTAFTALMNQQAIAGGRPVVGFLNPYLYGIGTNSVYASCFHDITIGNNCSTASPTQFYAAVGYDLCTGWGSPAGSNLINAIAGPPVLSPLIVSNSFAILAESCVNGFIDPGETVTVSLGLKNLGLTDTSNLVATLRSSGGVVSPCGPIAYGTLIAGGSENTHPFTFTATGPCGTTNNATLELTDGTSYLGTVSFSFLLGQRGGTPIFFENFDSVSPPALSTGWAVSWSGAGAAWATTAALADSGANSVFARNPNAPSDNSLISPSITIASASAMLTFRHNFYTETFYDGAVLEISLANGPFVDILTAGGSFVSGGYTQMISGCCGNPLANRPAWTGSSGGFITTTVNLPPSAAGQTIKLRWRFCSDTSVGATGWYVDTISVVDGPSCCQAVAPLVQSLTRSNSVLQITWISISNRLYRVQSASNLTDSPWIDLPGDILASGSYSSKSDPVDQNEQKFYRVLLLP